MEQKAILIVDSDHFAAESSREALRQRGYFVHVVNSASVAVEWLQSFVADLVVLEVQLSDGSGLDLCGWIRNDPATHPTPVVFLTASESLRDLVDAHKVGGDVYLTKPSTTMDRLAQFVAMFLAEGALMRRSAASRSHFGTAIPAPTA